MRYRFEPSSQRFFPFQQTVNQSAHVTIKLVASHQPAGLLGELAKLVCLPFLILCLSYPKSAASRRIKIDLLCPGAI